MRSICGPSSQLSTADCCKAAFFFAKATCGEHRIASTDEGDWILTCARWPALVPPLHRSEELALFSTAAINSSIALRFKRGDYSDASRRLVTKLLNIEYGIHGFEQFWNMNGSVSSRGVCISVTSNNLTQRFQIACRTSKTCYSSL